MTGYINPLRSCAFHLDYLLKGTDSYKTPEWWFKLWTANIDQDVGEGWSHLREVMIVASQVLQEEELKAIDLGG